MTQPIVLVDAFTDRPFAGNPAAVCLVASPRGAAWFQAVATEMNLSETAFASRRSDGDYDLRWFTPRVEVKLCGHATLATAHVLWEDGALGAGETVRFHTLSGLLTAEVEPGRLASPAWLSLDFPAQPAKPVGPPPGLVEALGLPRPEVAFVGRSREDYLVAVPSPETVRAARPDFGALGRLPARGVILTSRADPGEGYHFVSRFFAPAIGVPEDPVTGSAHCTLAPYWGGTLGLDEMVGRQVSARGGEVRVRLDAAGGRVRLTGRAVTVLRGELLTDATG